MKKILLIGKSGQLGGELFEDARSFDSNILAFPTSELDITNESQIKNKLQDAMPDVLINTAAYHIVPKCEDHPNDAMRVNFVSVKNLAKMCKKLDVTFVTYSTDYVFDGTKGSAYVEDDKPSPVQVYGISKLAGEHAALAYYPENTYVIRTSGLYGGAHGSPEKGGNFVLNIQKAATSKDELEIASEQVLSPTYAGDLSNATLKLLSSRATPGIYHLVNEGHCSWHEFAVEILKLSGSKTKVLPVDRKGKSGDMRRPLFSVLKNTKAQKLGIKLPSWKEGLKSYLHELSNL